MTRWDEGHDHRVVFPVPPMKRGWFYVYLAWGSDRTRPLYVGKANHPVERIGRHMTLTHWAHLVEEFECYGFDTEEEALLAESRAIVQLDPTYNIHRSNHAPRRAPYKGTPKGPDLHSSLRGNDPTGPRDPGPSAERGSSGACRMTRYFLAGALVGCACQAIVIYVVLEKVMLP